jgi:hypothetical protein
MDRVRGSATGRRVTTTATTVPALGGDAGHQAPQSRTERPTPPHLLRRSRQGNHFAAWQESDLFTSEVRAAFRSLRCRRHPPTKRRSS